MLRYALADGRFYVKPDTPIFDSAVKRGGVSIYTPGKCYPMLPRALSEDIMSLNANVMRRALVFCINLDGNGNVVDTKAEWSKIKSVWKGTYRECQEYYDDVDSASTKMIKASDFSETVDLLKELGKIRRTIAKSRGVVEYNREGCGVGFDKEGKKLIFQQHNRYKSELYNEQISLLCNSEGAKMLDKMDSSDARDEIVHPIYRSQGAPRKEQIVVFESIIKQLVDENALDATVWGFSWEKGEFLGDYLKRIFYHAAAQKDGGKCSLIVKAIERQAMMTNVAARFQAEKGQGHYALKMASYARFSSPMREIIGCFTHKELWEGINPGSDTVKADRDEHIRSKIIKVAIGSKRKQKQLSGAAFKIAMDNEFLPQLAKPPRQRKKYTGVIAGIDFSSRGSKKVYVRLAEPRGACVKVYVHDLNKYWKTKYIPKFDVYGFHGTTTVICPDKSGIRRHDDNDTRRRRRDPPTYAIANRVELRLHDHCTYTKDKARNRYVFILLLLRDE